ncbi:MAG: beta-ketoacyl-[Prevotella sp.]|nr:beta-ketoacyl-[acyl-carrier-protein] synthase family protein [Prevotella sp.]
MEVWITGAGIISAIGNNKTETLEALQSHRSGIAPVHYLQTEHQELPVGEVRMSDEQLKDLLGIHEEPTTRTALMGIIAMKEALQEAELLVDGTRLGRKIAMISGTTVGGMDRTEQYYLDMFDHDKHLEYIGTHDCGASTEMMADYFGGFDMVTTVSTACSSAANAIVTGANLIRSGQYDIVVVGGSECLTRYHLNGFRTLMILDPEPCRPFDATRAGLNLGEGASFLVLESEASARQRGIACQAILSGYGNACDAFHQTASSEQGEGAFLAMRKALQMADIPSGEIQYVNAHGTGTPNNDASESHALLRIFGTTMPAVSSTKAFTGHTTSASGSIEATICLLALQHQFIPVNLNWRQPMEDGIVPFVGEQHQSTGTLRHVMCNSFGFGGNDTSFILSSKEEGERSKEKGGWSKERIYIRAVAQISIQQPLSEEWMKNPIHYDTPFAQAVDPDFREFMNPMQSRRMGKVLRRALVTALQTLKESGTDQLDAIIMGTGLGCLENTERFLDQMCREGESLLKPTYFMQSTHNTISSMLGIQLGCHGYNTTYSHQELSFDSALLDAVTQMRMGLIKNALVCGNDELTSAACAVIQKAGLFGQQGQPVTGEGSVSMLLTIDPEGALCEITNISFGDDTNQKGSVFSAQEYFGGGFNSSAFNVYAAVCCLKKGVLPDGQSVEELTVNNHTRGGQVSHIQLRRVLCD